MCTKKRNFTEAIVAGHFGYLIDDLSTLSVDFILLSIYSISN